MTVLPALRLRDDAKVNRALGAVTIRQFREWSQTMAEKGDYMQKQEFDVSISLDAGQTAL